MLEALQGPVGRSLKLPPQPDPPLGAPDSLRVFRAAPGFLRYRLLAWGWKQASAVVGLVSGIFFLRFGLEQMDNLPRILRWLPLAWLEGFEYLAIVGFLLQLPVSFLLVALDYRYRWYLTTDRSLRIREGLWKVQERTMTFSNIQNVEIRQGPLQRLFGIADLRVQTAGGGGKEGDGDSESSGDDLHVGHFRGVANAAEIRDAILAQLRRLRDSGLGDPDEAQDADADEAPPPPVLEAARTLLREARTLTAALREL